MRLGSAARIGEKCLDLQQRASKRQAAPPPVSGKPLGRQVRDDVTYVAGLMLPELLRSPAECHPFTIFLTDCGQPCQTLEALIGDEPLSCAAQYCSTAMLATDILLPFGSQSDDDFFYARHGHDTFLILVLQARKKKHALQR